MNLNTFIFLSLLPGSTAFQPVTTGSPLSRTLTSKLNLSGDINSINIDEDVTAVAATRRSFVTRSLATIAVASLFSTPSYAAEESSSPTFTYEDPDYNFRIQVPSSWENTEQKLSGRRKAAFFTDPTSKNAEGTVETLGFIAYTPVRDDFTGLGSFGSVDNVAQTTILPKGELAGLDDASKMLSAVSKNNAYYFDYMATPVVPTEPGTSSSSGGTVMTKTLKPLHFRTIFTLLPLKGSAGNTLVTVTLQTTEERYKDVRGVFDRVVDSYGKMK
mmetsp:Transcript_25141/g.48099  ORF Transcript_25141/g.48099 Transcript_25141/m.48099 type:complete len:273 (+) Transcript_25141:153-971(+)|eukprot:CAMPEP_0201680140 /NCGR_PEP_ID=MMETSP0494-20130426/50150_1 /ASSEMBLY_ACC=CAM_ASM_000839 /TAXON_ID=420259 /ORGANISM="Thalassiosira gravida, Strain GMp14c1" /LENGTH=272 /DNA_ID=CAMNT_0048163819 /DNA_START=76 /DNA_END=894 /DNA_ORIENTATION=+